MSESFHVLPEAASKTAIEVDRISLALLGICVFFSLGIAIAIVYCVLRYRHSRNTNRDFNPPRYLHWVAELTWMFGPLAILVAMFAWGAAVYIRSHRPPVNPLEINVVAKQWMWKAAHPSGKREINSLTIPLNRSVRLTLISEDAIHSFYVPAFRVKQDVLPGRYSTLWFDAIQPGQYHLFCAEYCGTEHSRMIGKVVVLPQAEYAEWTHSESGQSLAQAGRRRVEAMGCMQCHGVISDQQVGPSLAGLYGRLIPLAGGGRVVADNDYLREAILNPAAQIHDGFAAKMPSYEGQLEAGELLEIIAYIRSIANASGPIAGPAPDRGGEESDGNNRDSATTRDDAGSAGE